MDECMRRKLIGIEKFSKSLGIKSFPKRLLIRIECSCLYDKVFGREKFIITDTKSQRKMKEKGIHDIMVNTCYCMKLWTSEIDSFGEMYFMVEGIRKGRFERISIKSISGEIEGVKGFHSAVRGK